MKTMQNRSKECGAVALEYILLAALVAIALISTFVYFREGMTDSTKKITDTATSEVQKAIDQGTKDIGEDE
ncbi:MAG: hypothetical protein JXR97_08545 [Planctomycetes bacterium]|nr:hypothetical protein [Planctomycetota bacterium]